MKKSEYDHLQKALDVHLYNAMQHRGFTDKERCLYEDAVLRCKSVLLQEYKRKLREKQDD
jgi:hypothetical protein